VLLPFTFDVRGIRERVKVYKRQLECNRLLFLTLLRSWNRGKIKTNPSVSCFLIPFFFKEGQGEIFCKKEKQKDKSPCFHL